MRRNRFWRAAGTAVAAAMLAMPVMASAASADVVGVQSYEAECYGYWGTFRDGVPVYERHWPSGGEECFGIAPNRTIWHAWPGSGGWQEMPGNGRADDFVSFPETNGRRVVKVYVVGSSTDWCNANPPGSASWGSWYRC